MTVAYRSHTLFGKCFGLIIVVKAEILSSTADALLASGCYFSRTCLHCRNCYGDDIRKEITKADWIKCSFRRCHGHSSPVSMPKVHLCSASRMLAQSEAEHPSDLCIEGCQQKYKVMGSFQSHFCCKHEKWLSTASFGSGQDTGEPSDESAGFSQGPADVASSSSYACEPVQDMQEPSQDVNDQGQPVASAALTKMVTVIQ